jgi:hypothetical protein
VTCLSNRAASPGASASSKGKLTKGRPQSDTDKITFISPVDSDDEDYRDVELYGFAFLSLFDQQF